MKPHRKAAPAEAAAAGRQEMPRCAPKADSGLSSAQAQALAEAGWDNRPVESPTKSDKQIIRENIFTYFNLIFVVLAVCLLLVGDWKDMTFLLIVAANAVIGIVQQLRSKRTIEKLSLLSAAKVRIIRDGKVRELPVDQLVREDVVELTAGCQIPADGPVLTGQVQVNEALITGEADAVTKEPGDQLLSGSFVISGKCRARMDQVGADSYASKLTLAAKKDDGPGKSEMMRSLDSLIRFIGIVLIPIGAALFYNQFINQDLGLQQSVVSTVAALIGMIPEGLFLLTSDADVAHAGREAERHGEEDAGDVARRAGRGAEADKAERAGHRNACAEVAVDEQDDDLHHRGQQRERHRHGLRTGVFIHIYRCDERTERQRRDQADGERGGRDAGGQNRTK